MGWAFCGQDEDGRDIGYGVPATCDHPGCTAEIDRGLSYVCGGMHGGDGKGCGKYFCEKHLSGVAGYQICDECAKESPLRLEDEDEDDDEECDPAIVNGSIDLAAYFDRPGKCRNSTSGH